MSSSQDLQKQKMKELYDKFLKKMSELFIRKTAIITDLRHNLESRKINQLRDELMRKK